MQKVPSRFKNYFWEYNFRSLSPIKDEGLIISRLLEKGDMDCVKWIFNNYGEKTIRTVLGKGVNLTAQTVNFWNIVLELNEKPS